MATSEESPLVVRDVNIATSECDGCLITTGPPEKPLTSTQTKSQEPKKRFVGQAEYYCPPREVPQNVTVGRRIFLGGTIEMGNSPDWQREATVALSHLPVTIFNPRRPDWHSDWEPRARNPYFNEQVVWELGLLESSEIIAFYLHPETSSVISLLEIGLYCRAWQGKLAPRRPRDDDDDDDPADKARDLPDYEKDPAKTQTQPTTKTILVCCPDGYNRLGNVEIVCHRYGIKMVQTFSELIERVIELVAEPGTEPGIKPRDIEKWRLDKERGGWMDKDTGEHVEERPPLDPTDSPTSKPRFSPIANEVSVPDTIPQIDSEAAPSTTSHSRTWFGTQRASEAFTSVISRFAS